MCGHGMIGVVATLAHLGRIAPGDHRIETPVGVVTATLHADGSVSVANVPSWRQAQGRDRRGCRPWARLPATSPGAATGSFSSRRARQGSSSPHVEPPHRLYAAAFARPSTPRAFPRSITSSCSARPPAPAAHSRNFVLCPGLAYDRSPCGTGTSAKLACLAADGKLAEGEPWVQEGILGSTFTGRYRWLDRAAGRSRRRITGTAHITAEATLLLDDADPFCWGIKSRSMHVEPARRSSSAAASSGCARRTTRPRRGWRVTVVERGGPHARWLLVRQRRAWSCPATSSRWPRRAWSRWV